MRNYNEFARILVSHSKLFANCKFDFNDPMVIEAWYDCLKDLSNEELFKTIRLLCVEQIFFPSIAEIVKKARPKPSKENLSTELVNRIYVALSDIGYYREKDAYAFLGELGWKIVRGAGGWKQLCNSEDSEVCIKANLRRSADQNLSYLELGLPENFSQNMLPPGEQKNPILQKALALAMNGKNNFVLEIN